jgi:hypothetical protein
MASISNNEKCKVEEEAESSAVRKRLQLSNDDSSESPEVEMEEEEVSLDESSMNQLDSLEDKLLAKRSCGLFFSHDGDTTSMSLEPRTPKMPSSCVCSDPDGSDDDDDDFWM